MSIKSCSEWFGSRTNPVSSHLMNFTPNSMRKARLEMLLTTKLTMKKAVYFSNTTFISKIPIAIFSRGTIWMRIASQVSGAAGWTTLNWLARVS